MCACRCMPCALQHVHQQRVRTSTASRWRPRRRREPVPWRCPRHAARRRRESAGTGGERRVYGGWEPKDEGGGQLKSPCGNACAAWCAGTGEAAASLSLRRGRAKPAVLWLSYACFSQRRTPRRGPGRERAAVRGKPACPAPRRFEWKGARRSAEPARASRVSTAGVTEGVARGRRPGSGGRRSPPAAQRSSRGCRRAPKTSLAPHWVCPTFARFSRRSLSPPAGRALPPSRAAGPHDWRPTQC